MSEDSSRAVWLQQARSYLRDADPVLARLIDGRPDFDPRAWMAQLPPMDLYGALLFQVTGQQLSVPATRRTLARIQALFGGRLPAPAELLAVDPGRLREAGLSWRKVGTLRDLAERLTDDRLNQEVLSTLPDDELMAELTAIPGIGPWTVQGALLIALQREDVVLAGRPGAPQGRPGRISAGSPAQPAGGSRHRREVAALPQPGHQLPVLRRLRVGRGTAGHPAGNVALTPARRRLPGDALMSHLNDAGRLSRDGRHDHLRPPIVSRATAALSARQRRDREHQLGSRNCAIQSCPGTPAGQLRRAAWRVP